MVKNFLFKKILFLIGILGFFTNGFAQQTHSADCSAQGLRYFSINEMMGSIKVPADLAIGGTIKKAEIAFEMDCRSALFFVREIRVGLMNPSIASGVSNAAKTNIEGIGYRVWMEMVSGSREDGSSVLPSATTFSKTFTYDYASGFPVVPAPGHTLSRGPNFKWKATIELVKTAAKVGSGPLAVGRSDTCLGVYDTSGGASVINLCYQFQGASIAPTANCTVTSPASQLVSLPPIENRALEIGEIVERPFSIGLSCPSSTRVYMTMTDANSLGNRSSILTLSQNSQPVAKGVGVQLRNANGELFLGKEWFVNNVAGQQGIELKARYVKVGNVEISPGKVNAISTITFRYD